MTTSPKSTSELKHRVGLALGGGGARGAAHLGVIEELNARNISPDLITGTSIGALVGVLLAKGLTHQEMRDFFRQINVGSMFRLPGSQPAISRLSKFTDLLESTIGTPQFSDLPIPFSVVATNLVEKKEVVLDDGDVISAVMASMAFPVMFPPVERDGRVLVDGGLMNQVPFDVVRARGATFVIAVDLGNATPFGSTPDASTTASSRSGLIERALTATKRRPMWQVLTTVTDIITDRNVNTRLAISRPDVLLRPNIGSIGLLDFQDMDTAIEVGRNSVVEAAAQLNGLRSSKS